MKKGKVRFVLGIVLVVLQAISIMGNAKAGISMQVSFVSLGVLVYDLIFLVSYNLVGIIGIILLVSGIKVRRKGDKKEPIVEEKIATKEPEELPGFTIPLPIIMPILIAIFVVILTIVLIFD